MERDERPAFHTRLRVLRAERGISRRELADAVGVHYQTIGYIERSEYSPSLILALKLAQYFELPVDAVFSLEPFAPLNARALSGTRGEPVDSANDNLLVETG